MIVPTHKDNTFKALKSKVGLLLASPLIKNFFIYSGGAFFSRSITILLAPINIQILTPGDYGKLSLLNSFISIACAIAGLGLRQVLSIEYFHGDETQRKRIINDIIIIYACIAGPVLATAAYYHQHISTYVFLHQIPLYLILLSIALIFIYFFVELLYQVMQYEQRAAQLTWLQVGVSLITIACTITLLWFMRFGFASIIIAQLSGMSFAFMIGLKSYITHSYQKHATIKHSIQKTKTYLMHGLPFIPSVLFGWILASSDRWVLATHTTMHHVGIYTIADTFSTLFQFLILVPWSGSYLPYIMNKFAKNKDNLISVERWNQRIMIMSMIGIGATICTGYAIGKPIMRFVLPPSYYEAMNYILLLLLGQVFLLGSYFASSFIQFHKKTYFLAFALCVPATLNVLFNRILVPHLAIYGCVFATVGSYALYFLLTLFYNWHLQKHHKKSP
jgi:O-antigen/teichoic acid export membrane protein